jgi:hypothetical protein
VGNALSGVPLVPTAQAGAGTSAKLSAAPQPIIGLRPQGAQWATYGGQLPPNYEIRYGNCIEECNSIGPSEPCYRTVSLDQSTNTEPRSAVVSETNSSELLVGHETPSSGTA